MVGKAKSDIRTIVLNILLLPLNSVPEENVKGDV